MKELLATVAVLLAIAGNVPYLRDVLLRKTRPHPFTWLVWSIVSAVSFGGQVAKGAGVGAIPTGFAEMFTIVIFFFSLRYGFRDIARRDVVFLVAALVGLIPWILTKDPTISVVTVVSIDSIAFVPTLGKAWQKPETETATLYVMNVLRHILTLFSLNSYNVATTLHSIAMIIVNTIMSSFVIGRRGATS